MALLLQGVIGGAGTENRQGFHLKLHDIAFGSDEGTRVGERRAYGHSILKGLLGELVLVDDELEASKAGAVVDLKEGDVLGVTGGAYPTADHRGGVHELVSLGKKHFDIGVFHDVYFSNLGNLQIIIVYYNTKCVSLQGVLEVFLKKYKTPHT